MISGRTTLIAHLGYPTETFKAPMIYNPWFERHAIDAVVMPMGVKADDYEAFLRPLFRLSNIHGALVTMPHKVTTVALLDEVSVAVQIAGSCNAILRRDDGSLYGDMFDGEGFTRGAKRKGFDFTGADCLVVGAGGVGSDGEGFTRGAKRKGFDFTGADCLVVGAGGVGSAIAAAIASEGPRLIALCDPRRDVADGLAARLRAHYPNVEVALHSSDPAGYGLVVNATPLGMKARDPLPFDPSRLDPATFVGEVVLKAEMTPLLDAVHRRGCRYLVGTDMLYEQIPAYLDFFGYGRTTPEELRDVAKISY
jgi:shikimate dehydrogenase